MPWLKYRFRPFRLKLNFVANKLFAHPVPNKMNDVQKPEFGSGPIEMSSQDNAVGLDDANLLRMGKRPVLKVGPDCRRIYSLCANYNYLL